MYVSISEWMLLYDGGRPIVLVWFGCLPEPQNRISLNSKTDSMCRSHIPPTYIICTFDLNLTVYHADIVGLLRPTGFPAIKTLHDGGIHKRSMMHVARCVSKDLHMLHVVMMFGLAGMPAVLRKPS